MLLRPLLHPRPGSQTGIELLPLGHRALLHAMHDTHNDEGTNETKVSEINVHKLSIRIKCYFRPKVLTIADYTFLFDAQHKKFMYELSSF